MRINILIFLLFLSTLCCGQKKESPYVLLISFDGFRYDYVEKYDAPNFKKFISKGVASEGLIPSFPSKTFPNHYTLVTGLYPGNHGLVDNTFFNPENKKQYSMKDKKAVLDPIYYNGTPLWQLAQQQGVKAASLFWVGSEAPIKGKLPNYYLPYKESMPDQARIDTVLTWLALPEKARPHFISLYFSLVDTKGHDYGPESNETKGAVLKADSLVGSLMNSLAKLKLPIHVIIVSDHGMLALKQQAETYIVMEDLIDPADTSVMSVIGGTQTHLYTKNAEALYAKLKPQENHFKIYKRTQFPERWHYDNPRAGDLLLVADPGYYIRAKKFNPPHGNSYSHMFGTHGFDPQEVLEMRGIFYAQGPMIKVGEKIQAFENIHVYPLIAKILNLKIESIDGKLSVLEPILR